ncbi:MAG TPA: cytochrome c [Candidatus Eisenbacteria bacterium]|nr:cytochrome c [Candidatus Eisenbacteria bacterium]
MARRATLRRSVMMIVLAAATTTACITGSAPRMVGTGDVVADRQRIMRLQGEQMTDIQNKIKAGGNIEGIAGNAEVLAITSMQITSLFPEGSLTDKSNAKPEIWVRWGEFEATARNMTIWSERLRDAAKNKDQTAVADVLKDYGRVTCVSCHDTFRKPLPRS